MSPLDTLLHAVLSLILHNYSRSQEIQKMSICQYFDFGIVYGLLVRLGIGLFKTLCTLHFFRLCSYIFCSLPQALPVSGVTTGKGIVSGEGGMSVLLR